jgi:hypothetical protein
MSRKGAKGLWKKSNKKCFGINERSNINDILK